MRGPSSRRPSVAVSLCLCTSALLAFVLRALPWRNYLLADGSYLLGGPDSYDHLRRILLGIRTFPGLPPYDYYYGYPKGIGQVWAPLFDRYVPRFLGRRRGCFIRQQLRRGQILPGVAG